MNATMIAPAVSLRSTPPGPGIWTKPSTPNDARAGTASSTPSPTSVRSSNGTIPSIDEARRRGTTYYSPDVRTPLHPPVLSEDRASLLAGTDKPCLVWTIDLDGDGEPTDAMLQRSVVRVREAISYGEAQQRIEAGSDHMLELLREIGTLRQRSELRRGGISLNLPSQEVVERRGTYQLEFDRPLPVEGWNAQISLLTGIVAGNKMRDERVGVLRTLPPPRRQDLQRLRRSGDRPGNPVARGGLVPGDDPDDRAGLRDQVGIPPAGGSLLPGCRLRLVRRRGARTQRTRRHRLPLRPRHRPAPATCRPVRQRGAPRPLRRRTARRDARPRPGRAPEPDGPSPQPGILVGAGAGRLRRDDGARQFDRAGLRCRRRVDQ